MYASIHGSTWYYTNINILHQFPALTTLLQGTQPILHNVTHHIKTNFCRTRRLAPKKRLVAQGDLRPWYSLDLLDSLLPTALHLDIVSPPPKKKPKVLANCWWLSKIKCNHNFRPLYGSSTVYKSFLQNCTLTHSSWKSIWYKLITKYLSCHKM